ncbi:MAG: nucleoid-associated protein [Flavobacteriaceae bacterium]|nr:nucleoid-associated protein [Flavobacteriaceae bacterium]
MIKRNKANLPKLIIHKIGNKFNDTRNLFSENPVVFDEDSYKLMLPFLLKPFGNLTESFRFHHHADVNMNEINNYSKSVFQDEEAFVEISKNIVKHLYEQSNSAQIKTGDVIIAIFEDIEYNDVITNAIGIFKIENKIDFFQTFVDDKSIDVMVQKGISTKKIDKGCLIVNYTDDEGYVVLSVDNNNYDTQYWIKNFLNIKYADDKNNHTQTYMEMCKDFSNEVLKNDYSTQEQSHFLAKTIDYLKENDTVNIHDFKDEVFEIEEQKELFDEYKKVYESDNDVLVRNQFHVSDVVVKKQKQKMKTEIKLDTNIQIKLDIDAPDASSEYLEQGYDEAKKMKYYKVYFNEEI